MKERVKVCPKCGKHNDEFAEYCAFCPTPLERVAVTVIDQPVTAAASVQPRCEETVRMAPQLVCEANPAITFELHDLDIIGRMGALDATPLPRSAEISRIHAQFLLKNGQWFIKRLKDTNGTKVNGIPLTEGEARPLKPGDRVELAATALRFQVTP